MSHRRSAWVWLLVTVLGACVSRAERLVEPGQPNDVRSACRLAETRCTRCHTLDRVRYAKVESPEHWERYVDRMRRQPHSGITRDDARIILSCLVWRTWPGRAYPEETAP